MPKIHMHTVELEKMKPRHRPTIGLPPSNHRASLLAIQVFGLGCRAGSVKSRRGTEKRLGLESGKIKKIREKAGVRLF